MPIAILTVGVSASGKSTVAKSLIEKESDIIEINRDNIRMDILCEISETCSFPDCCDGVNWDKWDIGYEREVSNRFWKQIHKAVNERKHFIISDTNLNHNRRYDMISFLKDNGYGYYIHAIDVELDVAIERDSKRKYPVGPEVIKNQYQKFLEFMENKPEFTFVDKQKNE